MGCGAVGASGQRIVSGSPLYGARRQIRSEACAGSAMKSVPPRRRQEMGNKGWPALD